MAVTVLMNIKEQKQSKSSHLYNSIDYILRQEKTEDGLWVGGNAGTNTTECYKSMMDTKREWGKLDGRQGYHYILAFRKGETDAATCFDLAKEFCEIYLGDQYDYVFSVHTDKPHIHAHIVFNSVNRTTGYKYRYESGDWEKKIQPITDELCKKYGLSVLVYDKENRCRTSYVDPQTEQRMPWITPSYIEYMSNQRIPWMQIIRCDIDYAIQKSHDYNQFLENMRSFGYQIRTGYSKKQEREYLTFYLSEAKNGRRDYQLGAGYSLPEIQNRINKVYGKVLQPPRILKHKIASSFYQETGNRYQAVLLKDFYKTNRFYEYANPFAVENRKIRKNLFEINKLYNACIYLKDNNLQNSKELEQQYKTLQREEKFLKGKTQDVFPGMELVTDNAYKEYKMLQAELKTIDEAGDDLERILERMEVLEEHLSEKTFQPTVKPEIKDRLLEIRKEKSILRYIRKNPELKITKNIQNKSTSVSHKLHK